jgi:hypothetical protein
MSLLARVFGGPKGRTRTDLLNHLIATRGYRDYLEIGVRDRRQNFDKVNAPGIKHGLDPDPQRPISHKMTSDAFFAKTDQRYDLVFIDGLHIADQVERDILNSLRQLNPGGAVILHDVNPMTADAQTDDYDGKKHWNGTVWKAWVKLRTLRADLSMKVVDIDEGCGVIERGTQQLLELPSVEFAEMSYDALSRDRTRLLNLVSASDYFGAGR